MNLSSLISVLLNGVLMGGVYGLTSSAFSFQCGVLKFANFSYGASIMLSMYLTFLLMCRWDLPVLPAVMLILMVNLLMGYLLRKTVLRSSSRNIQILCTMGVQLILINGVTYLFTSYPRDMALFESRVYLASNISIGILQFACFVFSGLILISFQIFLTYTWTGRAIRAVVQNREAAELMGIKSTRILDLAFSLSYGLIGISGILLMVLYQVEPTFGNYIQTIAFVVCISAGLGNLGGAFLSGILVGVFSAVITFFVGASYHDPFLFGAFVIILLIRPFGIFASRTDSTPTY